MTVSSKELVIIKILVMMIVLLCNRSVLAEHTILHYREIFGFPYLSSIVAFVSIAPSFFILSEVNSLPRAPDPTLLIL